MTNTKTKATSRSDARELKKIDDENKQLKKDVDDLKKLVRVMSRNAKLQDRATRSMKSAMQNLEQKLNQVIRSKT